MIGTLYFMYVPPGITVSALGSAEVLAGQAAFADIIISFQVQEYITQ